ncbi:nucleotidyltransferase family protein [Cognatishimia sp. WU-CL00825]|uniref:nucleotidyltransferase family protein n=1 Tax=Cognatishimia sp. WU-CL00825 TaxID=3127658 RepID=UPI0031070096
MPINPNAVMLFAAGFGTRMGSLTAQTPKPLIKVGATALIDHTLSWVQALEPIQKVANTHYLAEQLHAHLATSNVQISHETPEILDTGGGLRHALPLLGNGPIYTSNTDAIWHGPNPFELARAAWQPEKMDGLLVCISKESAIGHTGPGDFIISENTPITRGSGAIYGGVQIIKTDLLHSIPEARFSLNLLWDKMIASQRLFGLTYPGKWCDVGSAKGIKLAEDLLGETDV